MALYLSSATPDLTRTTTTNTPPTWASKLTHTINVENGKTYALIWMCVLDAGTVNDFFYARFRNTTDGVDLSTFQDGQSPITQRQPFGGVALFTAVATTTKTVAIEFAGAATNVAGCQQARISAFELESGVDFWAASNSDSSRASTTYSSKVAVTVNPAAASNFLICASYAANLELQSKINDGSADIYLHDRHDYWGVGVALRHPSFWFTKRAISSPTTFDLLAASGTGTSLICHAYIVALDLAKFAGNLYGESLTQGNSTGAYASRATVSGAVNAGNHLVLGSALQFGSATAVDLSNHKLRAAGADIGVPIQFKIDGTTYKYSAFMMSIENLSAGSPTIDWQWARDSGAATHSILSNVVAAIELAAASAAPVYTQVAYRFYNDDGSGLGDSVTAIAAVTPLWFANHENSTGDHETQWLTAEHAGGASGGGGFFNSGTNSAARSTNFAHSATRSVRAEVNPGGTSAGVRAFRWAESRTGADLYYSFWTYFPSLYTVTGGSEGEFFNTMQFKTVRDPPNQADNDPTWTFDIRNGGAGGAMRLEMCHHGQQLTGAGLSFLRLTQTLNPTDIPVGQWVHFETFLHQATVTQAAGGSGSIVRVWQDGVLIFEIGPGLSHNQSKPSKYDDAGNDQQWSVNCYTDGTTPNPAVIYIDDAVIAAERVYGKTVVGL